MRGRILLAWVAGLALLGGCGGEDDGRNGTGTARTGPATSVETEGKGATANANRVEKCMKDIGYDTSRYSPGTEQTGDVQFQTVVRDASVLIYVAEGSTDPESVFQEAKRIERERYEVGKEFGKLAVVRRGHTVFAIGEKLPRSIRKRIEGCGV